VKDGERTVAHIVDVLPKAPTPSLEPVEEVEALTPAEQLLFASVTQREGAGARWLARQQQPHSDEVLTDAIAAEIGDSVVVDLPGLGRCKAVHAPNGPHAIQCAMKVDDSPPALFRDGEYVSAVRRIFGIPAAAEASAGMCEECFHDTVDGLCANPDCVMSVGTGLG
jgi:hypothetical protein